MMASVRGYYNVLCLLLEAGANINQPDIYHTCALEFAVHFGHWACANLLLAHGAFVKGVFTLAQARLDNPEMRRDVSDLFHAAGGHNFVAFQDRMQRRKIARQEREAFAKAGQIYKLKDLCKEFVHDFIEENYPGTNLFPLVKALPIAVGLKSVLLNGVAPPQPLTPKISLLEENSPGEQSGNSPPEGTPLEVPLERALRCTSTPTIPLVCAYCLRSRAELRPVEPEASGAKPEAGGTKPEASGTKPEASGAKPEAALEICGYCGLVAYCSAGCRRNHWALAHMATCEEGGCGLGGGGCSRVDEIDKIAGFFLRL